MIVKCNKTQMAGPDVDTEMAQLGYFPEAIWPIAVGRAYKVFGICFFNLSVFFLIVDENDGPTWCPAFLFDVVDHSVPMNWVLGSFPNRDHAVKAVLGYFELATDTRHYAGLIERNEDDVLLFNRRTEASVSI